MSYKERNFIPRAQQPAAAEEALPPVTEENIDQVLAEAPVPKRSEILKQPVEAWPESDIAHRLRQCVNFLHANGAIPDGEAIRLKEEIEQQERT